MKRTRLMAVVGRVSSRKRSGKRRSWKKKKYTIKSINCVDVISTDPRKKQLAQQAVHGILLCVRDDVIGGFRARYSDGFYRVYFRRGHERV